jgi:hypothetical protein
LVPGWFSVPFHEPTLPATSDKISAAMTSPGN